jgi:hypothetical protein
VVSAWHAANRYSSLDSPCNIRALHSAIANKALWFCVLRETVTHTQNYFSQISPKKSFENESASLMTSAISQIALTPPWLQFILDAHMN